MIYKRFMNQTVVLFAIVSTDSYEDEHVYGTMSIVLFERSSNLARMDHGRLPGKFTQRQLLELKTYGYYIITRNSVIQEYQNTRCSVVRVSVSIMRMSDSVDWISWPEYKPKRTGDWSITEESHSIFDDIHGNDIVHFGSIVQGWI